MNEGLITIYKRGGFNDERMCLDITDRISGLSVSHVEVNLQEFMRALTGSCSRDCQFSCYTQHHEGWGKKVETEREYFILPKGISSEKVIRNLVVKDYRAKYGYDSEWKLHHSGIGCKQDGERWYYTIARYIEDDNTIVLKESEGN